MCAAEVERNWPPEPGRLPGASSRSGPAATDSRWAPAGPATPRPHRLRGRHATLARRRHARIAAGAGARHGRPRPRHRRCPSRSSTSGPSAGPAIADFGSREVIDGNWDENFRQTQDAIGDTIDRATFDAIRAYVAHFLDGNEALLRRRREEGWIRDGHGDPQGQRGCLRARPPRRSRRCPHPGLHRVQRSHALRRRRGRPRLPADGLRVAGPSPISPMNCSPATWRALLDADLPLLLPFYECYRAYVVAKISTFAAADPHVPAPDREEAAAAGRHHFGLAAGYAGGAVGPRLIVVAGPSGSGQEHPRDGPRRAAGRALALLRHRPQAPRRPRPDGPLGLRRRYGPSTTRPARPAPTRPCCGRPRPSLRGGHPRHPRRDVHRSGPARRRGRPRPAAGRSLRSARLRVLPRRRARPSAEPRRRPRRGLGGHLADL